LSGTSLDLNGGELILDADGDTSITADTDDQIDFKIAGSDTVHITSTGLGIGSSPQTGLHVEASDGSVNGTIRLTATGVASSGMAMDANGLNFGADTGGFVFKTGATANDPSDTGTERMRVTSSGRLILGGTSDVSTSLTGHLQVGEGNTHFVVHRNDLNNQVHVSTKVAVTFNRSHYQFQNPNGTVGSITTLNSATSFNTSSDYRLKENVVTDWDATTRLKQLKPSRFNFKANKDITVDGFLAHEVSGIVPEAITGEKDETQDVGTIKDKDGNLLQENVLESEKKEGQTWTKTKTENVYQGIDQSKLVPLLVKTVQELEARITALESK